LSKEKVIDFGYLRPRQIGIAAAFGAMGAASQLAGIMIPVAGPICIGIMEIFVMIGAALSGPIGGIIVGTIDGLGSVPLVNVPAHMVTELFMGYFYKKIWKFSRKIRALLWAVLVANTVYLHGCSRSCIVIHCLVRSDVLAGNDIHNRSD